MDDLYFRTKYDYYSKKEIIDIINDLLIKNKIISFDEIVVYLKKQYNVKFINKKILLDLVKNNFLYEKKMVQKLPESIFDTEIDHMKEMFRDILIYRFDEDINIILNSFKENELKKGFNDNLEFEKLYPIFKNKYTSLKAYRNYIPYLDYKQINNQDFNLKYFVSSDFYNFLITKNCFTMKDLLLNLEDLSFYIYYDEINELINLFHIDFMDYIKKFDLLFTEQQNYVLLNKYKSTKTKLIADSLNISESRIIKILKNVKEKYEIFQIKNHNLFLKIIKTLVSDPLKTSLSELKNYLKNPEIFVYLNNFEEIKEIDLINLDKKNKLYKFNLPKIFKIEDVTYNINSELFIKIISIDYNKIGDIYVKKSITNLEKIKYADDSIDIISNYQKIFNEEINKKSLQYYNKVKNTGAI